MSGITGEEELALEPVLVETLGDVVAGGDENDAALEEASPEMGKKSTSPFSVSDLQDKYLNSTADLWKFV